MRFDDAAGWTALNGFVDDDQIASVLRCCERLLALPPAERHPRDRPVGGTVHLQGLHQRCRDVAELLADHRLQTVVTDIVGPHPIVRDVGLRSPRPGFGGQTLHADAPAKLGGGPDMYATAIVALCEFTPQNGATRVVPGSHRRPDLQRLSPNLQRHPDEIVLAGEAGTAFVFSGHLLHSGMVNHSAAARPALQITWSRAGVDDASNRSGI